MNPDRPAVLLLAYGSPSAGDDMAAYLADVREGRAPSPELVAEMQHRYTAIGGSPLTRWAEAQARALETELRRRGRPAPVYVGMRHWTPRIAGAVARMKADGVTRAVAIAMAPHFSALSGGRYARRVEEACIAAEAEFPVRLVTDWWEQPRLTDCWASRVREGLDRLRPREDGGLKLIFSAHSLPARIRALGDAYEDHLRAHAERIALAVGWRDWMFAFQSAGASPEPWLRPALEEVLPALAREGYRRILIAPIGFVCDHVEVLYDLDIEAQAIAADLGLELARPPMPNDDPDFIAAAADAVEAAAAEPMPGASAS
jgi:protoporphyrin/coproporphyrin ferrochelatase